MYQDGNYFYSGQYSQTICQLSTVMLLQNLILAFCDFRIRDSVSGSNFVNSPPETFSWQDPVHSWKAGPGEVMTVENLFKSVGPGKKSQINKRRAYFYSGV